MIAILLLVGVTVLYAGYNLFIKISGGFVPSMATTTVLATISLQLAALSTSLLFLAILHFRGGHVFSLSVATYGWAIAAGVCIGLAEIGYLYLFGGVGLSKPMEASTAIPAIVSGTIIIAMLFSGLVLREVIGWQQILGGTLVVVGIVLCFVRTQG